MVHLSFNERLTAREDIAVEDDEGLPDDAAWHLTARASSTASQRDELPHATTKGGFLADLCVWLPQPSELLLLTRVVLNVADGFRDSIPQ